jgi:hypothetical protein
MNFTDEVNTPRTRPKLTPKQKVVGIIIILLLLGGLASAYYLNNRVTLPPQIVNLADTVNFTVYYPSKLPSGYTYTDGSAKIQTGLFYYRFHNGTKVISVTEQPIPASAVNLQNLPKYSSLNVPAGPAAIGVSIGNPSVVIATGSTLVNLSSSKGVTKTEIVSIAQKMTPQN